MQFMWVVKLLDHHLYSCYFFFTWFWYIYLQLNTVPQP